MDELAAKRSWKERSQGQLTAPSELRGRETLEEEARAHVRRLETMFCRTAWRLKDLLGIVVHPVRGWHGLRGVPLRRTPGRYTRRPGGLI